MLLVQPNSMLLILLYFCTGLNLMSIVDGLASCVIDYLHIRVFYLKLPSESYLLYGEDLRVRFRVLEVGMEVFDVLDLARLGDPVSIFLEPSPRVKSQDFPTTIEYIHKQKETANDSAGPSLAVIAVEHGDPLLILIQKLSHPITNSEQHIEGRSLVILPIIIYHILQHVLIYPSSTHVDSYVFVMMLLSE